MKADLSRQTFDPNKRYSSVLMQQGRVLLDSEWNEQQEIHQHRAQTGARDVIGASGVPMDEPGFEITARDGKLYISDGHIYVDGILCVNEKEASYDGEPDQGGQPHPPHPDDLIGWMASESAESGDGKLKLGLVYLDVWERHVTHLDDGHIREVALGGPDTTTRKQTVWQVKVMGLVPEKKDVDPLATYAELRAKKKLTEGDEQKLKEIAPRAAQILGGLCEKGEKALDELGEPPTGKLNARAEEQKGTTNRCQVPPGGGYERLENQLYRLEVHRSGQSRADARFKWSRDNGCVVTSIESVNVNEREITVKDTGRDEFLSFANGQWVEIVDDQTELQSQYRKLLQIDKPVDHAGRVITVKQTPPTIDLKLHPKLRRWDQKDGATEDGVKLKDDWTELEYGVEVKLSGDEYRAGDYWLIPARTATGDIEWPLKDDGETPEEQSPYGVRHGFCALAIVAAPQGDSEKVQLSVLHDCRKLFPPLTQLTSFFYLGGDGQEAMPGKELLEPLRVGVANGQWPVQGARVRFEILDSNGTLKSQDGNITGENSGKSLTVLTDEYGVAACRWTLDKDTKKQGQRVRATLLEVEDETLHLPVNFSANLSVASQVAYETCKDSDGPTVRSALQLEAGTEFTVAKILDELLCSFNATHLPLDKTGQLCETLNVPEVDTVQDALDTLCRVDRGGGCSVTVGEGGSYETLRQAFEDLRGRNDIHICLLPGDHDLSEGLLISNHANVEIAGYTPGARMFLGKARLIVDSLTRFTLGNVEIRSDNSERPLTFNRCEEVRVESCYLTGIVPEGAAALLTAANSDRIQLANNRIEAFPEGLDRSSMVNPSIVFADVDDRSRELFEEDTYERFDWREFEDRASEVARHLSELDLDQRKDLAQHIRSKLPDIREEMELTPEELESYERFIRTIETDLEDIRLEVELFWRSLLRRLIDILVAASPASPRTAVIIEDAESETILENNHVVGTVSLYGEPGRTRLTDDELRILGLSLRGQELRPLISLSRSAGTLRVLNNNLTRLTTAEDKVREIGDLLQGGGRIDGVFGRSFVNGNTIAAEDNLLLSHHLSFDSNAFDAREDVKLVGTVIGDAVIFMGNNALHRGITLLNATRINEKAANLSINIQDR